MSHSLVPSIRFQELKASKHQLSAEVVGANMTIMVEPRLRILVRLRRPCDRDSSAKIDEKRTTTGRVGLMPSRMTLAPVSAS
jgi:hypothetical protein